jgi:putative NADPH-quinone reductase
MYFPPINLYSAPALLSNYFEEEEVYEEEFADRTIGKGQIRERHSREIFAEQTVGKYLRFSRTY